MTPLEYAEELRKLAAEELAALAAPVPQRTWAQLGEVVLDCEALVVSVTDITAQEIRPLSAAISVIGTSCEYGQIGTIAVAVARECADVTNDDGTTDIPAQEALSEQQSVDSDALWNLGLAIEFYLEKAFSVNWTLLGQLSITTLMLTAGIP